MLREGGRGGRGEVGSSENVSLNAEKKEKWLVDGGRFANGNGEGTDVGGRGPRPTCRGVWWKQQQQQD